MNNMEIKIRFSDDPRMRAEEEKAFQSGLAASQYVYQPAGNIYTLNDENFYARKSEKDLPKGFDQFELNRLAAFWYTGFYSGKIR